MKKVFFQFFFFLSLSAIHGQEVIHQVEIQEWSTESTQWQNSVRYWYEYNADNEIRSEIRQIWQEDTREWKNAERKTRLFNEQQLPVLIEKEIWKNQNWETVHRRAYTYTFNESEEILTSQMRVRFSGHPKHEKVYQQISAFELERWRPIKVRYTKEWLQQSGGETETNDADQLAHAFLPNCNDNEEFDFQSAQHQLQGFLKYKAPIDGQERQLTSRGRFDQYAFPETLEIPVAKNGQANLMVVYPNPATDFVRIELIEEPEAPVEISILNDKGQLIHKTTHTTFRKNEYKELNTLNYPAGVYVIRLISGKLQQSAQFIRVQE